MIIYFHGLGSNGASPKVQVLRDAGFNVVAPDIPFNPAEAEAYLIPFIVGALSAASAMGDKNVTFLGTSLGGYWAARMGETFDAEQVLVNPSFTPRESLGKFYESGYTDYASGQTKFPMRYEIEGYEDIDPEFDPELRTYFIASRDPVVAPVKPSSRSKATIYDSDDHRGESFFQDVIDCLKWKQ